MKIWWPFQTEGTAWLIMGFSASLNHLKFRAGFYNSILYHFNWRIGGPSLDNIRTGERKVI